MKTTLNLIRSHNPCAKGWEKLLKHLGKTEPDDEPLSLATILESNGLDDALWCLRAVPNCEKEARLYAVWCARQVQHLMTDPRSLSALDVAERHADGRATDEELEAARAAAWDADNSSASDADEYEASEAAWDAAGSVAWDAVRDAAMSAAMSAAWSAARNAASAAASAAAWDADFAAAWDAARDAAREEQEKKFVEMFCKKEVTT